MARRDAELLLVQGAVRAGWLVGCVRMRSDAGVIQPRENRILEAVVLRFDGARAEEDRVKLDVLQFELLCQRPPRVVLPLPEQR